CAADAAPHDLRSFPTRRSSDLETTLETATEVAVLMRQGGQPMWANTLAYNEYLPAQSTSLLTSTELGQYDYDSLAQSTAVLPTIDRKSTRLNSSHVKISYAVFC